MSFNHPTAGSAFPLRPLLFAGLIGQLAFELYSWLISPLLFGTPLQPANLVMALTKMSTGVVLSYPAAFVIHTLIGIGFVGLVWVFHKIFPLGVIKAGAAAGFALWFVAQGILAPVVGRSFMMGFGTYTQSSFIAHVGMALIMGAVLKILLQRAQTSGAI